MQSLPLRPHHLDPVKSFVNPYPSAHLVFAKLGLGASSRVVRSAPSYEGLGLASIKAQAVALPAVISDLILEEVDLIPELISGVSLKSTPSLLANQIETALSGAKHSPKVALGLLSGSRFSAANEAKELLTLYHEWLNPVGSLGVLHVLASPSKKRKEVQR